MKANIYHSCYHDHTLNISDPHLSILTPLSPLLPPTYPSPSQPSPSPPPPPPPLTLNLPHCHITTYPHPLQSTPPLLPLPPPPTSTPYSHRQIRSSSSPSLPRLSTNGNASLNQQQYQGQGQQNTSQTSQNTARPRSAKKITSKDSVSGSVEINVHPSSPAHPPPQLTIPKLTSPN